MVVCFCMFLLPFMLLPLHRGFVVVLSWLFAIIDFYYSIPFFGTTLLLRLEGFMLLSQIAKM